MFDREYRGEVREFCRGFGGGARVREGDFTLAMPRAELFREASAELPESEVVLTLRVLSGIRDCEFLLEVLLEEGDEGGDILN